MQSDFAGLQFFIEICLSFILHDANKTSILTLTKFNNETDSRTVTHIQVMQKFKCFMY